jgi:enoyl-CoA hydratase
MTFNYEGYEGLIFSRPSEGVLLITLNKPEVLNAADRKMHTELAEVWLDVMRDPDTRVVVITGAGRAFSAGGDIKVLKQTIGDYVEVTRLMKEASDIVYNMIQCDKPIISAINGVAAGGGLAVALLADISLIAEGIRLTDSHVRIGIAAGDHSVILWPLLCGMARSKYYLMTADFIDASEAERIGLVSKCVPPEQLMNEALTIASNLAAGPQYAIQWTKKALNNWLRMAGPMFDASLALEMIGLFGGDVEEGVNAIIEKRTANFPSAEIATR